VVEAVGQRGGQEDGQARVALEQQLCEALLLVGVDSAADAYSLITVKLITY